jgi:hypothetical protein
MNGFIVDAVSEVIRIHSSVKAEATDVQKLH